MSNREKKLLVFTDDRDPDGHSADFRATLEKGLTKISYTVFEDFPKAAESIFSVTIEKILFSDAIILDGAPNSDLVSADSLIQYGICYALQKKCTFVAIKNSIRKTDSKSRNTIVERYVEFDYYLDFENQLSSNFTDWLHHSGSNSRIRPNQLPVHSYVVFGIDRWKTPDLYDVIENFSNEAKWKPRIISELGSLSKLESLAIQVSQRSFCIFCLNEYDSERIFLGIGLAIGMGRPFLIIKHKSIPLPIVLSGYHGVIEYENFSQLRVGLRKYAREFLTAQVFQWEGSSYNNLLANLEKRIGSLDSVSIGEFEKALVTVASISGEVTAKPFVLLAEIYREKNRKFSPDNIELLRQAKEYYEKALKIQKDYQLYQNAISAIDKHMQLIELIRDKKYRSIPTLINLLGEELKSDHYFQVKEYLLSVVNKLVEEKDFAHAISLLAAMQIHDKSLEIQKLIQQILNSAPLEIIKALQDSQKQVIHLENEKTSMTQEIKIKEDKIGEILSQLSNTKAEIMTINREISQIKEERDGLKNRLENINIQLIAVQESKQKLEKTISDHTSKGIGDDAKKSGVRGILVNFGFGWAVYKPLTGNPYIIQKGEVLPPQEGFILLDKDVVLTDTNDGINFIDPNSIVIDPNDTSYSAIKELQKRISQIIN